MIDQAQIFLNNLSDNAFYKLYTRKCDQTSDLWQQLEVASEFESNLPGTMDWVRKCLVDFNARRIQLTSFDKLNNSGAISGKIMGLILKKIYLLECWDCLLLITWIGASCTVSIAENASKKIRALIHCVKFVSSEVALYPYKSYTIFHVWTGSSSCCLDMLDKLQKQVCWTVGPSLFTYLDSLAHRQNVTSLIKSFLTLVDVHLNWLSWFHVLMLVVVPLIVLIGCVIFCHHSPVSFFTELGPGILCLKNAFLWPVS